MEIELREELGRSIFIETPKFLEMLFDVSPNLINQVYNEACSGDRPFYRVSDSRWAGFPALPLNEKELCAAFVGAANFITQKCASKGSKLDVRWLSDPNRSPALADSSAADMKPDIISVLGFPFSAQEKGEKPPWRRILVPVEVKKSKVESAAALQLLKYMRQIFHESLDRRFVFGIVLAQKNLYVYLADRSGVLGSEIFDIHEVSNL